MLAFTYICHTFKFSSNSSLYFLSLCLTQANWIKWTQQPPVSSPGLLSKNCKNAWLQHNNEQKQLTIVFGNWKKNSELERDLKFEYKAYGGDVRNLKRSHSDLSSCSSASSTPRSVMCSNITALKTPAKSHDYDFNSPCSSASTLRMSQRTPPSLNYTLARADSVSSHVTAGSAYSSGTQTPPPSPCPTECPPPPTKRRRVNVGMGSRRASLADFYDDEESQFQDENADPMYQDPMMMSKTQLRTAILVPVLEFFDTMYLASSATDLFFHPEKKMEPSVQKNPFTCQHSKG